MMTTMSLYGLIMLMSMTQSANKLNALSLYIIRICM